MAYAVVRTDKMFGTDVCTELVSVKYIVTTGSGDDAVSTPTAIENGSVLKLGALLDGEREIYEGTAPAANDSLDDVVLVATPELMYDERKHNLDEFINEAGKAARGYRFHKHDIFSVTIEALNTALEKVEVGNVIELAAGTKMKAVASATSGSTVVGSVIHVETVGTKTFYAIEVGKTA